MNDALVACPKCKAALFGEVFNTSEVTNCPACQVRLQVDVFPALFQPAQPGQSGEKILVEGESSCFYHAQKKAVIPCDSCGRFLCALCDVELSGQHFCPACLETGQKKGKLQQLQSQRVLYDDIALALTLYPMVIFPIWFVTIITAPMALYIAVRYWNAPLSLVRRSKYRFVLAILFASLQILGWAAIIFFVITRSTR